MENVLYMPLFFLYTFQYIILLCRLVPRNAEAAAAAASCALYNIFVLKLKSRDIYD